jgi:pimeloyl-ACP methyl ester carboxylesterase
MRRAGVVVLAVLLVLGVSTAPTFADTREFTGFHAGARYRVVVPERWNGDFVVWSHGTYSPDRGEPEVLDLSVQPDTVNWLLSHGYAVGASGFRHVVGWSIADGLTDQVNLVKWFKRNVGTPRKTISAGASAGGATATVLAERNPRLFDGVVTECGMAGGGVRYWNSGLDLMFAVRTLLGGDFQLTHVTDPGNEDKAAAVIEQAVVGTPLQQARLVLANALADIPGWSDSRKPRPTSVGAQVTAMSWWDVNVRTGAVGATRQDMERWSGGNPTWNFGVDYRQLLTRSSELALVQQAYTGLDLDADLAALNRAATIKPDPQATAYLAATSQPQGRTPWPVLSVRDTGDGVLPIANDTPYAQSVDNPAHLRQLSVNRAGHCALTAAEEITAFQTLLDRVATGHWPATDPAALNSRAQALPPELRPMPPAFTRHVAGPYPRP